MFLLVEVVFEVGDVFINLLFQERFWDLRGEGYSVHFSMALWLLREKVCISFVGDGRMRVG